MQPEHTPGLLDIEAEFEDVANRSGDHSTRDTGLFTLFGEERVWKDVDGEETGDGGLVASGVEAGNAKRIKACWNALAGIENPAEFVEAARELLANCKLNSSVLYNEPDGSAGHNARQGLEYAITRFEKAMGGSNGN